MEKVIAKEIVNSIEKDAFLEAFNDFMKTLQFSRLRCLGSAYLSIDERKFLMKKIKKFFPGYNIEENDLDSIAHALTWREIIDLY